MKTTDRRALLRFLAASPVLAASPDLRAWAAEAAKPSATDALDVFDMEATAEKIVPPAHWGYLQSGADGNVTRDANHTAYAKWQLVPRRFVDVSHMDLSATLFGTQAKSPIFVSPIGSLRAFNIEADIGVARATKAKGHWHIVSTQMSDPIEDIATARGDMPLWYQLYTTNRIEATKQLLQRAERAGCTVVAITVDTPAGRNTELATRLRRQDTRQCSNCHQVDQNGNPRAGMSVKPMFTGIDTEGLGLTSATLNWDFIKRVKDMTRMKVVLKGIEAREDAVLAVKNGADGIIVSNHGGRATETGRGTVESLPEVVKGVAGKIPVLVDGGVRRGTDVYKALALGASAVGIGRPFAWGLASYGQAGVERVLDILNTELRLAMVGCGARTVKEITRASIVPA
jgi:4-hydroxymandelate oxidase